MITDVEQAYREGYEEGCAIGKAECEAHHAEIYDSSLLLLKREIEEDLEQLPDSLSSHGLRFAKRMIDNILKEDIKENEKMTNTYPQDAADDFKLLEEVRCLRCVNERILRALDEGLFVDYQLEKFSTLSRNKENKK